MSQTVHRLLYRHGEQKRMMYLAGRLTLKRATKAFVKHNSVFFSHSIPQLSHCTSNRKGIKRGGEKQKVFLCWGKEAEIHFPL
jgi:hypothetical protein